MLTRRKRMVVTAKIEKLEDGKLVLKPDTDISRFVEQKRPRRVEVRLDDGRTISVDQRRKILPSSVTFLCGPAMSRKNFGSIWNGISAPALCGSGSPSQTAT